MSAYLLKLVDTELAFEVLARGRKRDTIAKMRIALRSLLQSSFELRLDIFNADALVQHLALAKNSLLILQDDLETLEPERSSKLSRIRAMIDVFSSCLEFLGWVQAEQLKTTDSNTLTELSQLQNSLSSLMEKYKISEQTLPTIKLKVGVPLMPSVETSKAGLSESLHFTDADLVSEIPQEEPFSRAMSTSQYKVYNSLYGKLSHPVESLIKTLPHTDGLDLDKLLAFIKISLRIVKMYPDIALNINTERPLNSCLLRHKHFVEFHKEVLHLFFSTKRLSSLVQDLFYCPQRCGETLYNFVKDIRSIHRF